MFTKSHIWNVLLTSELKFQKWSIFVKYNPRKHRPKLVSKSAFLQIFIITGLKCDMILSVVDRNVAIFTTCHAIMHYEFQLRQDKLWQNSLIFCFPKLSTIFFIFLNHFYGCKSLHRVTSDIIMIFVRTMTDKATV